MASQPRSREREQGRRLKVRTLAIASVASLTAALVTSRLWIAGTPLAAAATPVIVALVSELLVRPVEVVGRRLTADRPALVSQAVRGRPEPRVGAARAWSGGEAPVTVYGRRRRVRRRLAVGAVVATGALAFAVAAAAMTLPELIVGQSLAKADRQTTLFGGKQPGKDDSSPTSTSETTPTSETETTPTTTTETSRTETETPPQQQPEYQPRQSESPPAAPSAQPTETRPAPTQTGPGSAQQP
jgi:hypothetical protein